MGHSPKIPDDGCHIQSGEDTFKAVVGCRDALEGQGAKGRCQERLRRRLEGLCNIREWFTDALNGGAVGERETETAPALHPWPTERRGGDMPSKAE